MLAWDVLVLNGYLALNLALPFYVHYRHWQGREPNLRAYFPVVVVAMFWAVSIHTVTAFLFSANAGRPFWHTALLGPRFIASAFVSGPALIIVVLQLIRRHTDYPVQQSVIDLLALVMAVSLQISLFFVAAELFTDFYNETSHAGSMRYLFFGLQGLHGLRAWIWTALVLNLVAVVLLSIHRTRRAPLTLNIACGLAFAGIWIEKGMGLVVPGFIPTPLGEVFEYTPTAARAGGHAGHLGLRRPGVHPAGQGQHRHRDGPGAPAALRRPAHRRSMRVFSTQLTSALAGRSRSTCRLGWAASAACPRR